MKYFLYALFVLISITAKAMETSGTNRCILLSGLSGCGKSTVGTALAAALPNCVFVEGDFFYLETKPLVILSTGEELKNWDSADAIDWHALNTEVGKRLEVADVVLATFLPRLDLIKFPVSLHVRLAYADAGRQDDITCCLSARITSKKFTEQAKQERDELMVREVVYPTYEKMVQMFEADFVVLTYTAGNRRPMQDVVDDVLSVLSLAGISDL